MKRLIKTLDSNNKLKQSLLILTVFLVCVGLNCVSSLDQGSSDNPINTGIIFINGVPAVLFGNAVDRSQIKVITEVFPDGSSVEFEITGTDLQDPFKGCLSDEKKILNNGQAFAEYLGGVLIGSEAIATVNVAVTITVPGEDTESDFNVIILLGVDIIPPADTEITSRPVGDPLSEFLTLIFQTIGFPPGTRVNFSVSNPAIGNVMPTSAMVVGPEESGAAITQYNTVNGTGGTQVITATITIPNPCPDGSDLFIQRSFTITQIAPEPTPPPTPPPPPTIVSTVANDTLQAGEETIVTAQTENLPSGTTICFDFPINSSPASSVDPTCAPTDSSGKAITILTAGNVTDTQIIVERECVDANGSLDCDDGELNDTVSVTIEAVPPTPETITVVADPGTIDAGEEALITATTEGLPTGTRICFDIPINSSPASSVSPTCTNTDSMGEALTILKGGNVTTTKVIVVRGCVDDDMGGDCDPGELNDTASVTIVAPGPTPTPTPTPSPAPTPSPSPTPGPTVTLTCPDTLLVMTQGTCTCSTNQGQGKQVCFEVISPAMPSLSFSPMCINTGIGGNGQSIVNAGMTVQTYLVQCCLSDDDNMCDDIDPTSDPESIMVVAVPTPTPTPTPTPGPTPTPTPTPTPSPTPSPQTITLSSDLPCIVEGSAVGINATTTGFMSGTNVNFGCLAPVGSPGCMDIMSTDFIPNPDPIDGGQASTAFDASPINVPDNDILTVVIQGTIGMISDTVSVGIAGVTVGCP